MVLIDTHAHIYLKEFDEDRESMITRAQEAGIEYVLLPHIDSNTTDALHLCCMEYPAVCYPMMGLHPTSVKADYLKELSLVEHHLSQRKYHAVGEVGIDLYWDQSFLKEQEYCFHRQIELALAYDLPLVVHSRNSTAIILDILEQYYGSGLRGVMHCFPGDAGQALQATELGFLLGIGGVVTYKNAVMASVVEKIPMQYLLLETDAPFLSPAPRRGARNECSYLTYVAEKIALLKGISAGEVAGITTENAIRLFRIKQ